MNYKQSLHFLNSFINYERLLAFPKNRSWNLDRMRWLLETFNHPDEAFTSVLIAGTKGKGSTGFFLQNLLQEAGIKTGFYSSPHVETPRERIRVEGKIISPSLWTGTLREIEKGLKGKRPPAEMGRLTYFEIMTLMAMIVFRRKNMRVGIFEVGLGGRLDATNVLKAELSLITTIGLDHEKWLGNTVEKIAREKAGIIKRGKSVVSAPQTPGVMNVIERQCQKMGAPLSSRAVLPKGETGLKGEFQRINAGVALRGAAILLPSIGAKKLPAATISRALHRCDWPGRMELFTGKPDILLDAAHNPSSLRALSLYLTKKYRGRRIILVYGTLKGKDTAAMFGAIKSAAHEIIITRAANPRAEEVAVLVKAAADYFSVTYFEKEIEAALKLAKKLSDPRTLIVVTGSFYVVGQARSLLKKRETKRNR